MKITNSTLRKIIREELEAAMNEIGPSTRTLDDMGEGELNAKLDGLERAFKDAKSKSDGARMERLKVAIKQVKAKLPHGGGSGPTGRAAMSEADDGFQIGSIKGAFSKEFGSRLQHMLAIKADLKKNLKRDPSPEELRKAMRAAGMRDPGEEAPMNEDFDVPHDVLFNLVKDAGIPMAGVNVKEFFDFLRSLGLTTADAIENGMGAIAVQLSNARKKNR